MPQQRYMLRAILLLTPNMMLPLLIIVAARRGSHE